MISQSNRFSFRHFAHSNFLSWVIVGLLLPFSVYAKKGDPQDALNEKLLAEAYKDFKIDKYDLALEQLEKISGSKKVEATKAYFQGLCFNRLKKFDKSIKAFQQALKFGHDVEDLEYELGQAYYATNHMEESIEFFLKSAKKKFKLDSSLYYVAYSQQLLEHFKEAKQTYIDLLKVPDLSNELKQASHMQLGEILLSMSEGKENQKELVEKHVIPRFEIAIAANPPSPLVPELQKRLTDIKRRFDLDPNVLKNGRILPEKRWLLNYTQKLTYDDNLTLATDLPTVQATQKDTFIHEGVFGARYRFNFFRRIVINPDLRITAKRHTDQDSGTVHQNDANTFTGMLQNTYEYVFFGKMASFLFDYEQNLTEQDRTQKHDIIFFSRYRQGTLGQKVLLFPFGDTGLKAKYKNLQSYSNAISSSTYTLAADQMAIFSWGHLLMGLFQIDYTRFPDNPSQDSNSYMARVDYIIPEIYPKYMLNLAYAHTWLNTINQKNTRGVENTYNPSFRLTRTVTDKLKATLSYGYTKKTSDNKASFAYSKQMTGLELRYDF